MTSSKCALPEFPENRDAPSCLKSEHVQRLEKIRPKWVDVAVLGRRPLVAVLVSKKPRYADKVTGSLYSEAGVCLSNPRYWFSPQEAFA